MPQGPRGKVAIHVFGLVLCSSFVGCMDTDKKPIAKPSGQLPGTPMLNNGASQNKASNNGQQPNFMLDGRPVSNNTNGFAQPGMNNMNSGLQPAGGFSNPSAGRGATGPTGTPTIPGTYQYPQSPSSVVPPVGPTSMNVPPANPNTNATAFRGQVDPQQLAMTDIPTPPPARAGNVPPVEPNPLAPVAPPMPGLNSGIPALPGTK